MPEQATLPELIEAGISRRLKGLHTACLGEMTSYDSAAYTCSATLAAKLDGQEVEALEEVPVLTPGDWAAGDPVLLVFSEEDCSAWLATGAVAAAPSKRRHGLYAVAIPLIAREGQATEFVALANLVNARFDRLETWADSHVHPTALGPSGVGAPLLTPGSSVAASKVKAR